MTEPLSLEEVLEARKRSDISRRSTLHERGAALRKFRVENGLTQSELGKRADLAESTISRFESGDRDLSPEAEVRLEQAKAAMTAGRYAK